jgi:putative Mg2+ transporter-C (MgtC) family protein
MPAVLAASALSSRSMDVDYPVITAHLVGALVAGGIIGIERTLHGHPAGFRTHTLVCLASSLLMLITVFQTHWLPGAMSDAYRTDPTRMAQGIMTGIGFLGAGVIFKEGLNVHGLTTAASIWITAAIGILIGVGFWFPAALATLLTLGTLWLFRLIEDRIPAQAYAHLSIRFDAANAMDEDAVRALIAAQGFAISNMSYRLADSEAFEYRMVIRTTDPSNVARLAALVRRTPGVREFRILPTGDQPAMDRVRAPSDVS